LISDAAPGGPFKRDARLAKRRGKDMEKLKRVLSRLIEGSPLPREYADHPLRGNWSGWRDLHVEPDWVLIYRVDEDMVRFERTGRHTDLFDE
jgi:mRNA interferase YafQ